jgi:hypothetical protein
VEEIRHEKEILQEFTENTENTERKRLATESQRAQRKRKKGLAQRRRETKMLG